MQKLECSCGWGAGEERNRFWLNDRCFLDFFSSFCIFALLNQVTHVPASDFSHSCTLRSDLDFLASISISANILPHPLHSGSLWRSLASLSVPVCNEEDDAGFTGKRFNSKMVVYSGSKTAYLPKMMTLYEQCIRVLQNNIDCEWICSISLSLWASLQGATRAWWCHGVWPWILKLMINFI